jgi:predicted nucleotide-binding protein
MNRKKVFIAHSSDDFELATELRTNLLNYDITCWLCDEIQPGQYVNNELCKHMQEAHRCVVLVTPSFVKSRYFSIELSLAITRQNDLSVVFCIPVLRGMTAADLPYELRNLQCMDGNETTSQEFLERLVTAIES